MSESEKNELDASKRATIDDYVKNLEDETFFLKNGREQAELMGVDPATISRWKKEVDWKVSVEVNRHYDGKTNAELMKSMLDGCQMKQTTS